MYHSITFERTDGKKNTWDDWFLIPSSRPVFNPPSPKTIYVDIPGADGSLDLSEAINGGPVYNNRTGSLEFIVDNGHKEWHELYSEIMDYLHGQVLKAFLDDDPAYYYEGRFAVNEWRSESHNSKITIDYNVFPYKMEKYNSLEAWKWDDFNFEDGIIRDYSDLTVDGSFVLEIKGRGLTVIPKFIVEGTNITVTFKGNEYELPEGESKVPTILLTNGLNILTFKGNGIVSVLYRGGRL